MNLKREYAQLSEKEIGLYKEELEYRGNDISEELFEELFEFNYDCDFCWYNGIFYHLYEEPVLQGPVVENYIDNTFQTLNYKTWLLTESDQREFIDDMKEKNIPKEGQQQYINGFPFVSAIVVPVEWYFDYSKTIEKYGFYPYSGKLWER